MRIRVMGALRDLQNNRTEEFSNLGNIGQNLPYSMLKFWLIHNPRANLEFSPDQLYVQTPDPISRTFITQAIDSDAAFKRCTKEAVRRKPNDPELRLLVVRPIGGGGLYATMTLNMM